MKNGWACMAGVLMQSQREMRKASARAPASYPISVASFPFHPPSKIIPPLHPLSPFLAPVARSPRPGAVVSIARLLKLAPQCGRCLGMALPGGCSERPSQVLGCGVKTPLLLV